MREVDLFAEVMDVVVETFELPATGATLLPNVSLIELGLDSLKAVDLAVALERRLQLEEFPIQDWADAEGLREEPRYTLGSLVATCATLCQGGAR